MDNDTKDVISKVVDEHRMYSTLEALWVHPEKEARREHLEEYESEGSLFWLAGALDVAEELGYAERFDGVASDGEFSRYRLTEQGEEALAELANYKPTEYTRESVIEDAVEDKKYDGDVLAKAATQLLE